MFSVPPNLSIENQLVAVRYGQAVTLACNVESQPASLNYWLRGNGMKEIVLRLNLLHSLPSYLDR